MSFRHVAAVLDHYPNGDARKLVLIALAEQANEATWICWPSLERIAKRACISERHAIRTIDSLEDEAVIDVIRGGRGRRRFNRYRVRFDVLKGMPSLVETDRPDADPLGGFEPIASCAQPVDNLGKETRHGVTFVQEKVTPTSEKGDIAMSPEPEEPEEDLLRAGPDDRPVDNSHALAVIGGMVEDLTASWTRP